MTSREENETSRVYSNREGHTGTPIQREPIAQPEALEVPPDPVEEPKQSIDDVVRNLIIHYDRPIENLPPMSAPELKLIGRCVSLSTKQTINGMASTYYYTGLVAAVTSAAVTLMYVNRYSEDDFKVYKERERAASRTVNASAQEMTKRHRGHAASPHGRTASEEIDHDTHHDVVPQYGYSAEGEVGGARDGGITGHQDGAALLHVDAAGSLAPAVRMSVEDVDDSGDAKAFSGTQDGVAEVGSAEGLYGEVVPAAQHRPHNFRLHVGSVGPLPYVSFLRKNIHDVRFGRDPRSSFYSLFQDPSKKLVDMQYLRMFVRRYIVHTSENNNPRQVPMYAFVTVRGACPNLDRELANQLVREELPGLMKADKAIAKDKKRNQNREVRRDLSIQEYHAPAGLFSRTGILYLTHTPQSTFLSAAVIVFFTIVFAIFLAVTLAVVADPMIVAYLSSLMSYFIASLVIWIMGGVCIGLHSVNMHIPLRDDCMLLIARIALTAGSAACCIMSIVMLLSRLSNMNIYNFMADRGTYYLCDFYKRNQCSGLHTSCADTSAYFDYPVCEPCPITRYYSEVCYFKIWSQLQIIVIPLLVFCVFLLLAVIHSVFQLFKLWLMVRALTGRFRS